MVTIETKQNGQTIGVKTKYEGSLKDVQMDMIAILADFGTVAYEKGTSKEDIESIIDIIADIAKKHIAYK